jgi:hypothetical protein
VGGEGLVALVLESNGSLLRCSHLVYVAAGQLSSNKTCKVSMIRKRGTDSERRGSVCRYAKATTRESVWNSLNDF